MKRIISLLVCVSLMTSCDYLDVVPDDSATIADAFKNESTTEAFLFTLYSYQNDYRNYRCFPGRMTTNEMMSQSRWGAQWFPFKRYIQNEIGSSFDMGTGSYSWRDIWLDSYAAIRHCYIFLDKIDDVVPQNTSTALFNEVREHWKGETYFLLAFYHHLLFQNYGPIVVMPGQVNTQLPRSSVDESVEAIVEWYDKAIELLPPTTGRANLGRANKMIAKAMKAKLLVYAASPLYNGDPENVFADATPEFKALMNLQRDNSKWERALAAVDEAIAFAEGTGSIKLYEFASPEPVTGRPAAMSPERKAYLNVRTLMSTNWNSELIWGFGGTSRIEGDQWERHVAPKGLGTRRADMGDPVGGMSPTLAAVKLFYTAAGLPPESDPNRGYAWTEQGRMSIPAGENTCNLHLNREPRFYAAIGYDQGIFEYNNWTEHTLKLKRGTGSTDHFNQGLFVSGTVDNAIQNQDRLESGYSLKKTINPNSVASSSAFTTSANVFPLMRLADLYLLYVEACAEAKGNLDAKAQSYIEKIHNRAGLNGSNFYYKNYTGAQLVEAVRRERMIELIFESHWHFDLRRWQMADKWHNEGMWGSAGYADKAGMWGLNILGTDNDAFYQEVYKLPGTNMSNPYIFDKRMYFAPIFYKHININDLLVQNPGY